jgi:calcium-dependent protein kinase
VEPTKLKFDKEVMDALKSYKGMSKLRMAALNVFLHMLEPKDIEPLREIFHSMDSDKTGFISASELHEALKIRGADISDEQVSKIISEVDEHKNGKINYSEFLAATVDVNQFMSEEKLWMIFKHFDVDDTEYISKENISEAFQKMGKKISNEEIDAAIGVHDIKNDGRISFEEFK